MPPKALAALALASVVVGIAACSSDDSDDDALRLEVVSSQPQYVTGGNAVVSVELDGEEEPDPDDLEVLSGSEDVSDAFAPDPDRAGRFVGVVEGLPEGETVLEASVGGHHAELAVTNHPTTGPLFSGEQFPLMGCNTDEFGLDTSTPREGCYAPPEVTWEYVDRDGEVHDLADPSSPPRDVELLELGGKQVPFVIRTETGVLNRAVYQIVMLEDEDAWNERLVYRFGGGCAGTFGQGGVGGSPSLEVLRRGYASATATFNTFGVLCNDVISAETMSMVKEHFVVTHGEPVHTIGEGGSGGAIQQLLLAQNYPGLLDGIAPSLPFPDALSIFGGVIDCRLLNNYYRTGPGRELSEEQRRAINGHWSVGVCATWDSNIVTGIDPTTQCAGDDDVYHPKRNPDGFRCTFYETNVEITGRDPETGFARPGYDNEGVQYGLDALNERIISPEEFLDLNEQVGGFDIDGKPQAERSEMDDDQVAYAFETGRITGPWGGLPDTAVILVDVYTDLRGDFHDRVRAFSLLDRLSGGEGDDSSQWPSTVSLWSILPDGNLDMVSALAMGSIGELAEAPTFALDEWLTEARELHEAEGGEWQDALAAAKPRSAESRCVLDEGESIVGPDASEDPACVDAMPVHREPRMVAGAPRSGDVLKCQLVSVEQAVDRGLYDARFTARQLDRLAEIFPDGVCDYRRVSVGYGPPDGTWRSL